MRRSYSEDRWVGQKFYPILIVEKDTMEPVCKPMARRWQMPFASSRGYGSLTLQHDVAEMLNRRRAAECRDELTPPHPFLPKERGRLTPFGPRAAACYRSRMLPSVIAPGRAKNLDALTAERP
jgi:hypothetical protein